MVSTGRQTQQLFFLRGIGGSSTTHGLSVAGLASTRGHFFRLGRRLVRAVWPPARRVSSWTDDRVDLDCGAPMALRVISGQGTPWLSSLWHWASSGSQCSEALLIAGVPAPRTGEPSL